MAALSSPVKISPLLDESAAQQKPIIEWDSQDIRKWLIAIQCDAYIDIFERNHLDTGLILLSLSKPDLKEMVPRVGDRIQIVVSIKRLRAVAVSRNEISAAMYGLQTAQSGQSTPVTEDYITSKPANSLNHLWFCYPDGSTKLVNIKGCHTAQEIKSVAVKIMFPSIQDNALSKWRIYLDDKVLSDQEVVDYARNSGTSAILRLTPDPEPSSKPSFMHPGRPQSTVRPTSRHVSMHLSKYFPDVDAQELRKTVRNSTRISRRLSTFGDPERFSRRISNLIVPETVVESPQRTVVNRRMSAMSIFDKVDEAFGDTKLKLDLSPTHLESTPSFESDSQLLDQLAQEEMSPTKWIKGARIGSGSFGTVYMGMNSFTGELIAVKQVNLPTDDGVDEQRKRNMVIALQREILFMRDFDHKNIVQYRGFKQEELCLNIFLEYVPGGSLSSMLSQYGAFEEGLVRHYIHQILEGLNYLHDQNIIHRDIKGANILVSDKGQIKISDFGISKKAETQNLLKNTPQQTLQGSVYWMAPEIVKQTAVTLMADIWSVGCLVIELLSGSHPFPLLTPMQAIFKLGNDISPDIPENGSSSLKAFVTKTFALKVSDRPSAQQLLLDPFVVGSSS